MKLDWIHASNNLKENFLQSIKLDGIYLLNFQDKLNELSTYDEALSIYENLYNVSYYLSLLGSGSYSWNKESHYIYMGWE